MNSTKKPWDYGPLRVLENGRYLANGSRPFFWLGDTAWLLFQNLNSEETGVYLRNRRDKGFNLIQATLIHTLPKAKAENNSLPLYPNSVGSALWDNDFTRPNMESGFWQHVDSVLDMAEDLGLYMALLPCWGAMVKQGLLTAENAAVYGDFLIKRYGKRKNILWLLGGDIRGDIGGDVWELLADSLSKGGAGQLTGYHPFGRTSSSLWFGDAPWLDFNMFQSGHRRYDQMSLGKWDDNAAKEDWFGEDNWKYVLRDYQAPIPKPTLDGEPSYEQIPQGLHDPSQPYWQDHDARRYAYWSVFEGACGHTYGHNAIMQFYKKRFGSGSYGVKSTWEEALHHPGSDQMGHLAALMNSVDFTTGQTAQWLLPVNGTQYKRVSAFMGKGFLFFYSYSGETFTVDLTRTGWTRARGWFFDPAGGVYSFFGNFDCGTQGSFTPPQKPVGHNDWVIVLKPEQ